MPMWWSRLLCRMVSLPSVDAVFADAEVLADLDALPGGDGAGSGCPSRGGSLPVDAAVRALVVVVVGEGVQLGLQLGDGGRGGLPGEPVLQALMQSLHLAAGHRMVGLGVGQGDAEGDGFAFQGDPAVAAVGAGGDRAVVSE